MDKNDPNTWTQSYVSSHQAECLSFLRETNQMVISYIRQGNYPAAIVGLDRIMNGLNVLHNEKCGDYKPHMAMFSLCEASIIAFGSFDASAPESKRRQTALANFQDAYDFSKQEETKNIIRPIIAELKSGTSLVRIREKYDQDFPQSTMEILTNMNSKLSGTSSPSSGTASGGCYIATAVYGSYDCRQVWTLRRYRDNILASAWYGRMFIRMYYAVSPILVRRFGQAIWFQKLWKSRLDRMVKRLNDDGVEDTPYEDSKS